MAQVLYRKYRSKKLAEIVGQDHITKTLGEALKSGRLSHAYLFTGPRGVGKTSVARILAHEVNQLNYNDDQPHIDIIEIDAASNRRIDEIRDLRDKVHILPASAPYKVYIIDEVHMLTKEAFNALLKTLEEPPAHVIFILATTDPYKLPDTIISRTQRFSFRPIDEQEAVKHLRAIASKERIKITDEALKLIAQHGQGSFRDSISLLDQLSHSEKEVKEDDVRQILGIPESRAIDQLIELIDNPSTTYKETADHLAKLNQSGFEPAVLAKQLMGALRNKLIDGDLKMPNDQAINLLKELLNVESAVDPSAYLLLCLLAVATAPDSNRPDVDVNNDSPFKQPVTDEKPAPKPSEKVSSPKAASTEKPQTKSTKPPLTEALWPEVLSRLKNSYNTLYGIVRMAEVAIKDNQIDLIFDFAFHQKQVSEARNKQIIADIIKELTDRDYIIKTHLNEQERVEKKEATAKPSTKDLDAISKIFGGGELVD